jgi:hypothetical protein
VSQVRYVYVIGVAEEINRIHGPLRSVGTYRPEPSAGQEAMTIGIEQFRDPRELRLDRMLVQPFHGSVGGYPIGRRAART